MAEEVRRTVDATGSEKVTLVPYVKPERELAAEYKDTLRRQLETCLATMNAAQRDGISLAFATGRNGFGFYVVTSIEASKPL